VASQTRPALDLLLPQLAQALVDSNPDALGHIDVQKILFVAGAARRGHRASIRPFRYSSPPTGEWKKPHVHIRGSEILYEICLRPLFFLQGNTRSRVRSIAHELWHICKEFDGTLEESRSHKNVSEKEVEAAVSEIVDACDLAPSVIHGLSHAGELTLSAWKMRPPSRLKIDKNIRDKFTEEDLFVSVVIQKNEQVKISR
jgi:hypothetical protein